MVSYLLGLNPFLDSKEHPKLMFSDLCQLAQIDYEPVNQEIINIFVVDEFTAIPYAVLESPIDPNKKNFG